MLKMFLCNRNQDIDVVKKHRVVWWIWQGGVEHSATWRSILFGYRRICPFKERIYELFAPLPFIFNVQSFPAVRMHFQGCFMSLFYHLLLESARHVTYNPPDTTCPLLLVLVRCINLLIQIRTFLQNDWEMSWCSNNVCQFRPTGLHVLINWMVRQAQASRQMKLLPSILHLCLIV